MNRESLMAKQKPVIKLHSYGLYSAWDSKSKNLPQIKEFTTDIIAELDVEFGFIINIKNARGMKIFYCIDHPGILDDQGKRRQPFTGEVHITNNDWDFYLGDTIWTPIEDKCGDWRMSILLNNKTIAEKTFAVQAENNDSDFKQRFFYP